MTRLDDYKRRDSGRTGRRSSSSCRQECARLWLNISASRRFDHGVATLPLTTTTVRQSHKAQFKDFDSIGCKDRGHGSIEQIEETSHFPKTEGPGSTCASISRNLTFFGNRGLWQLLCLGISLRRSGSLQISPSPKCCIFRKLGFSEFLCLDSLCPVAVQHEAGLLDESNSASNASYQGIPAQAIPESQPNLNPAFCATPTKVRILEELNPGMRILEVSPNALCHTRARTQYLPAPARCVTGLLRTLLKEPQGLVSAGFRLGYHRDFESDDSAVAGKGSLDLIEAFCRIPGLKWTAAWIPGKSVISAVNFTSYIILQQRQVSALDPARPLCNYSQSANFGSPNSENADFAMKVPFSLYLTPGCCARPAETPRASIRRISAKSGKTLQLSWQVSPAHLGLVHVLTSSGALEAYPGRSFARNRAALRRLCAFAQLHRNRRKCDSGARVPRSEAPDAGSRAPTSGTPAAVVSHFARAALMLWIRGTSREHGAHLVQLRGARDPSPRRMPRAQKGLRIRGRLCVCGLRTQRVQRGRTNMRRTTGFKRETGFDATTGPACKIGDQESRRMTSIFNLMC
ncbi:hypothetical protein B0H15DRAFT_803483 [Mycena belliarum]|uniref:Uncharacterized protein n=1 Tax=Mycena belliarum TaxID=1033014 RepID=A0AAD6TZG4_9AGAR|nr:hypothetical protein B0H15DRAFT_803483 [Mycena belliae]